MATPIPEINFVFRFILIDNLEDDLINGLRSKNSAKPNPSRELITNSEIIDRRSSIEVTCHPGSYVNDYVPFYFSLKTPTLYNIITGKGVTKRKQADIIYLCYKLSDLTTDEFQWCFTDGNAAVIITNFYNDLGSLHLVDWKSIETEDFRNHNADGDTDRIRKKNAEFLVKNSVPSTKLSAIVVYNEQAKIKVDNILQKINFVTKVLVNPKQKFYF
jgi:hypothetical protein